MMALADIGHRLRSAIDGAGPKPDADNLLQLGELTLEHWVRARDMEPTDELREGFRLLALHRQGAHQEPSFNACRETCRELVYHYNLVTMQPEHEDIEQRLQMMALVANHLFLFVSGRMETRQLGDFCCSSRPLHAENRGR
jgi:hypothetical protein